MRHLLAGLKTLNQYKGSQINGKILRLKQYGEMETGSTVLAFANELFVSTSETFRPNRPSDKAAGVEIAFVAFDVTAAFRRACSSGAVPVFEPETKPWGQVVSYVRDLNGLLIEICSEIASS